MKREQAPRPSIIYGEVGVRLLELNEPEKAYELFVLAGRYAIDKQVITEPIREEE